MGDQSTSPASRDSHSVFLHLVGFLENISQPKCSTNGDLRCLFCDGCRSANKLNNMRIQAEDIKSTLAKMSSFGHDFDKLMEEVELLSKNDQINLVGEPSFEELARALEHFTFNLPYTSFYEFPRNDQELDACPPPPGDTEGASLSTDTMKSRYESLNPLQQKCLFYCSVFDEAFKKRVLINWWIGEKLLQGNEVSLESQGEEILKILERKEFIVPLVKRKRDPPNTWRMEPSVRQFVRSKWDNQSTEAVLPVSDPEIDSVETVRIHETNILAYTESLQVLRLGRSHVNIDSVDPSRVKTVLNINKSTVGSNESKILASMQSLQVLHLGKSHPKHHVQVREMKLILEGLRKMKQLRLLSLEGILSIRELPRSSFVCETLLMPASLTVLDLRGCQAFELLPSSIGSLKNLRHLDLSDCHILRKIPREIRFLSKLEVLKGFVIGHKDSCTLEDLGLLKKLHKLSICVSLADFPQHPDLVNLANIQGLLKLKIQWRIIASQQNQGKVDSLQNEQTEQKTEIASQQNKSQVDSLQNLQTEQKTEIASQQNKGNAYSLQNEQATEITFQQNQGNVDSLQNEQTTEIKFQQKQGTVDSLQNEQTEQTTDITSQQNQGNVDSLQNEQTEQATEIAEAPHIEGARDNANSGAQEHANPVHTNPVKPAGAHRLFSCWFGNQIESKSANVFKKLEKLDVWCAPASAASLLLDPHKFPRLKQLYIRGAAFHRLPIADCWLEVEKLRLLFLTHFDMQWEELRVLFPVLSYLEMQNCRNLVEFSQAQHCDEEGVWLKTQ